MISALQPQSVTVRYGTTIATCGRALANMFLMGAEPVYAAFAISSNVTGLAASHTKSGVTVEAGLAVCALTALGVSGIAKDNPMQIWMAGVGMVAFGNAFINNVRYTKVCPKQWRKSEAQDKIIPDPLYAQKESKKKSVFAPLKNLAPVTLIRKGAQALAHSQNDRVRKFGEDAVEITNRKMFSPGVMALIGVTPFIVDGIQQGMESGNWSRAIGGSIIFIANTFSMFSIPQKQKHPIVALVHELKNRVQRNNHSDGPTFPA